MPKVDIKAMIKDLKKNELTELISVAQEVLSTLFNSSEIRDNVKESRFSKGYECPKCQCKDVNKNGKSNGRQRKTRKRKEEYQNKVDPIQWTWEKNVSTCIGFIFINF